ncbi:MAG TPA: nucleotidyltransferase domain-containing protein [Polyangiaceae bacterium]
MILTRPFRAVTPTVDGDVLSVLARADASFTPPQVRDLIGFHSVDGVRNALVRLTTQGVLRSEQVGRAYTYRLNREHVAASHIIGLAQAGREVLQRMRARIEGWAVPCEYAALFGSAATGTMTDESDLDVFVVRPDHVEVDADSEWYDQLDAFIAACTSWTGNDTRILELSASEVEQGVATERVLLDIARDGIDVAGPEGYLSRYGRPLGKRKVG